MGVDEMLLVSTKNFLRASELQLSELKTTLEPLLSLPLRQTAVYSVLLRRNLFPVKCLSEWELLS